MSMVSPGYEGLCSQSTLPITGKRPYRLCWGGLGFLSAFLFFCLLLSQELSKSELHPSAEERGKSKAPRGTGDCGCAWLWERCRDAKPAADVSRACGEGSQGACKGLTNSCLHRDTPNGIYKNPSTIKRFWVAVWPSAGCIPETVARGRSCHIAHSSLSPQLLSGWNKISPCLMVLRTEAAKPQWCCCAWKAVQGTAVFWAKLFHCSCCKVQDAQNELAGWGLGRFCTYLREQTCYHKIAEKKLDGWFRCLEDVYHQQRHTARAWKAHGEPWWDSVQTLLVLLWQVRALLGLFLSLGIIKSNILQGIVVLLSFFWPDPLNSPNKSQRWVSFQWSVPAQSDTADHKAERNAETA